MKPETFGIAVLCVVWFCILAEPIITRYMEARRKRLEFKLKLKGYRFTSYEELIAHWETRLTFNFDGPFDPNRYGTLYETLHKIDTQAQKVWDDRYK